MQLYSIAFNSELSSFMSLKTPILRRSCMIQEQIFPNYELTLSHELKEKTQMSFFSILHFYFVFRNHC